MIDAQDTVLINGEATRRVDFADRGLHYGDGVFTTLSVRNGIPLFLNRHLARLQADTAKLNLPFPDPTLLADEARRLASRQAAGVLKIMLTRGTGGRGYRCPETGDGTRIFSLHPAPVYPAELSEQGIKARLCELRLGINPRLAGIKHLNRLEQVLARAEWQDNDIREGLLLDYEGFVVEGVMSNLFVLREDKADSNHDCAHSMSRSPLCKRGVRGDSFLPATVNAVEFNPPRPPFAKGGDPFRKYPKLSTPLLDRCGVAGVMRGLVLEAARDLGLPVEEIRLRPDDLFAADALFLTNSVIGIWPVRQLEQHLFAVSPITRQLSQLIDAWAQP